MAASLKEQLATDRAVRDQALALVKTDLAHLRTDYAEKGIGERAKERIVGGATDVYEEAAEVASDNRGVMVAVVAALLIWLARNPILSLFSRESDEEIDEDFDDFDEDERRYAR